MNLCLKFCKFVALVPIPFSVHLFFHTQIIILDDILLVKLLHISFNDKTFLWMASTVHSQIPLSISPLRASHINIGRADSGVLVA